MSAARAPCVVDYSTGTPRITTLTQPTRPERFTPEQVKDSQLLSDVLARVTKTALDASYAARTNPLGSPTVHAGLAVAAGGATIAITHGLGRKVFWWPVGFAGASGPSLAVDPSTDLNTLVLQSFVAGVLDLAVA